FPDAKVLYNKDLSSDVTTTIDMIVVDKDGVPHVYNFLQADKPYVTTNEKDVVNKIAELNAKAFREGYKVSQTGQNRTVIIPYNEATNTIDTKVSDEFTIFATTSDKSGNAKIDALVANLRSLSSGIRTSEEDRLFSQIASAINSLLVRGEINSLIGSLSTLSKRAETLLESYQDFKKSPRTDEEIADFARTMDRLVQYMQVFSGTAAAIDSAMKENPTMFKDVPLSKLSNLRYLQGKLAAI